MYPSRERKLFYKPLRMELPRGLGIRSEEACGSSTSMQGSSGSVSGRDEYRGLSYPAEALRFAGPIAKAFKATIKSKPTYNQQPPQKPPSKEYERQSSEEREPVILKRRSPHPTHQPHQSRRPKMPPLRTPTSTSSATTAIRSTSSESSDENEAPVIQRETAFRPVKQDNIPKPNAQTKKKRKAKQFEVVDDLERYMEPDVATNHQRRNAKQFAPILNIAGQKLLEEFLEWNNEPTMKTESPQKLLDRKTKVAGTSAKVPKSKGHFPITDDKTLKRGHKKFVSEDEDELPRQRHHSTAARKLNYEPDRSQTRPKKHIRGDMLMGDSVEMTKLREYAELHCEKNRKLGAAFPDGAGLKGTECRHLATNKKTAIANDRALLEQMLAPPLLRLQSSQSSSDAATQTNHSAIRKKRKKKQAADSKRLQEMNVNLPMEGIMPVDAVFDIQARPPNSNWKPTTSAKNRTPDREPVNENVRSKEENIRFVTDIVRTNSRKTAKDSIYCPCNSADDVEARFARSSTVRVGFVPSLVDTIQIAFVPARVLSVEVVQTTLAEWQLEEERLIKLQQMQLLNEVLAESPVKLPDKAKMPIKVDGAESHFPNAVPQPAVVKDDNVHLPADQVTEINEMSVCGDVGKSLASKSSPSTTAQLPSAMIGDQIATAADQVKELSRLLVCGDVGKLVDAEMTVDDNQQSVNAPPLIQVKKDDDLGISSDQLAEMNRMVVYGDAGSSAVSERANADLKQLLKGYENAFSLSSLAELPYIVQMAHLARLQEINATHVSTPLSPLSEITSGVLPSVEPEVNVEGKEEFNDFESVNQLSTGDAPAVTDLPQSVEQTSYLSQNDMHGQTSTERNSLISSTSVSSKDVIAKHFLSKISGTSSTSSSSKEIINPNLTKHLSKLHQSSTTTSSSKENAGKGVTKNVSKLLTFNPSHTLLTGKLSASDIAEIEGMANEDLINLQHRVEVGLVPKDSYQDAISNLSFSPSLAFVTDDPSSVTLISSFTDMSCKPSMTSDIPTSKEEVNTGFATVSVPAIGKDQTTVKKRSATSLMPCRKIVPLSTSGSSVDPITEESPVSAEKENECLSHPISTPTYFPTGTNVSKECAAKNMLADTIKASSVSADAPKTLKKHLQMSPINDSDRSTVNERQKKVSAPSHFRAVKLGRQLLSSTAKGHRHKKSEAKQRYPTDYVPMQSSLVARDLSSLTRNIFSESSYPSLESNSAVQPTENALVQQNITLGSSDVKDAVSEKPPITELPAVTNLSIPKQSDKEDTADIQKLSVQNVALERKSTPLCQNLASLTAEPSPELADASDQRKSKPHTIPRHSYLSKSINLPNKGRLLREENLIAKSDSAVGVSKALSSAAKQLLSKMGHSLSAVKAIDSLPDQSHPVVDHTTSKTESEAPTGQQDYDSVESLSTVYAATLEKIKNLIAMKTGTSASSISIESKTMLSTTQDKSNSSIEICFLPVISSSFTIKVSKPVTDKESVSSTGDVGSGTSYAPLVLSSLGGNLSLSTMTGIVTEEVQKSVDVSPVVDVNDVSQTVKPQPSFAPLVPSCLGGNISLSTFAKPDTSETASRSANISTKETVPISPAVTKPAHTPFNISEPGNHCSYSATEPIDTPSEVSNVSAFTTPAASTNPSFASKLTEGSRTVSGVSTYISSTDGMAYNLPVTRQELTSMSSTSAPYAFCNVEGQKISVSTLDTMADVQSIPSFAPLVPCELGGNISLSKMVSNDSSRNLVKDDSVFVSHPIQEESSALISKDEKRPSLVSPVSYVSGESKKNSPNPTEVPSLQNASHLLFGNSNNNSLNLIDRHSSFAPLVPDNLGGNISFSAIVAGTSVAVNNTAQQPNYQETIQKTSDPIDVTGNGPDHRGHGKAEIRTEEIAREFNQNLTGIVKTWDLSKPDSVSNHESSITSTETLNTTQGTLASPVLLCSEVSLETDNKNDRKSLPLTADLSLKYRENDTMESENYNINRYKLTSPPNDERSLSMAYNKQTLSEEMLEHKKLEKSKDLLEEMESRLRSLAAYRALAQGKGLGIGKKGRTSPTRGSESVPLDSDSSLICNESEFDNSNCHKLLVRQPYVNEDSNQIKTLSCSENCKMLTVSGELLSGYDEMESESRAALLELQGVLPESHEAVPATSEVLSESNESIYEAGEILLEATEMLPETKEMLPETSEMLPETSEMLPETCEMLPETSEMLPEPSEMLPETCNTLPEINEMLLEANEILPEINVTSGESGTKTLELYDMVLNLPKGFMQDAPTENDETGEAATRFESEWHVNEDEKNREISISASDGKSSTEPDDVIFKDPSFEQLVSKAKGFDVHLQISDTYMPNADDELGELSLKCSNIFESPDVFMNNSGNYDEKMFSLLTFEQDLNFSFDKINMLQVFEGTAAGGMALNENIIKPCEVERENFLLVKYDMIQSVRNNELTNIQQLAAGEFDTPPDNNQKEFSSESLDLNVEERSVQKADITKEMLPNDLLLLCQENAVHMAAKKAGKISDSSLPSTLETTQFGLSTAGMIQSESQLVSLTEASFSSEIINESDIDILKQIQDTEPSSIMDIEAETSTESISMYITQPTKHKLEASTGTPYVSIMNFDASCLNQVNSNTVGRGKSCDSTSSSESVNIQEEDLFLVNSSVFHNTKLTSVPQKLTDGVSLQPNEGKDLSEYIKFNHPRENYFPTTEQDVYVEQDGFLETHYLEKECGHAGSESSFEIAEFNKDENVVECIPGIAGFIKDEPVIECIPGIAGFIKDEPVIECIPGIAGFIKDEPVIECVPNEYSKTQALFQECNASFLQQHALIREALEQAMPVTAHMTSEKFSVDGTEGNNSDEDEKWFEQSPAEKQDKFADTEAITGGSPIHTSRNQPIEEETINSLITENKSAVRSPDAEIEPVSQLQPSTFSPWTDFETVKFTTNFKSNYFNSGEAADGRSSVNIYTHRFQDDERSSETSPHFSIDSMENTLETINEEDERVSDTSSPKSFQSEIRSPIPVSAPSGLTAFDKVTVLNDDDSPAITPLILSSIMEESEETLGNDSHITVHSLSGTASHNTHMLKSNEFISDSDSSVKKEFGRDCETSRDKYSYCAPVLDTSTDLILSESDEEIFNFDETIPEGFMSSPETTKTETKLNSFSPVSLSRSAGRILQPSPAASQPGSQNSEKCFPKYSENNKISEIEHPTLELATTEYSPKHPVLTAGEKEQIRGQDESPTSSDTQSYCSVKSTTKSVCGDSHEADSITSEVVPSNGEFETEYLIHKITPSPPTKTEKFLTSEAPQDEAESITSELINSDAEVTSSNIGSKLMLQRPTSAQRTGTRSVNGTPEPEQSESGSVVKSRTPTPANHGIRQCESSSPSKSPTSPALSLADSCSSMQSSKRSTRGICLTSLKSDRRISEPESDCVLSPPRTPVSPYRDYTQHSESPGSGSQRGTVFNLTSPTASEAESYSSQKSLNNVNLSDLYSVTETRSGPLQQEFYSRKNRTPTPTTTQTDIIKHRGSPAVTSVVWPSAKSRQVSSPVMSDTESRASRRSVTKSVQGTSSPVSITSDAPSSESGSVSFALESLQAGLRTTPSPRKAERLHSVSPRNVAGCSPSQLCAPMTPPIRECALSISPRSISPCSPVSSTARSTISPGAGKDPNKLPDNQNVSPNRSPKFCSVSRSTPAEHVLTNVMHVVTGQHLPADEGDNARGFHPVSPKLICREDVLNNKDNPNTEALVVVKPMPKADLLSKYLASINSLTNECTEDDDDEEVLRPYLPLPAYPEKVENPDSQF